jgi:hypothetical protein
MRRRVGRRQRPQLAVADESLVLALDVKPNVRRESAAQPILVIAAGRERRLESLLHVIHHALEHFDQDLLLRREVVIETRRLDPRV